ncbi:MAG: hypothetical protein ABI598_04770, partial [Chloroflexota bacterium]
MISIANTRPAGMMLLALLLVGCEAPVAPSLSAPPTSTPDPTPTTSSFPLDATAWYAGLVLHFDSATAVMDERGGFLRLDLRIENPGSELAGFDAPLVIESGGAAVEPVPGTTVPDIPPGGSIASTIQFTVGGNFGLAAAAVRVGRPAEHVVVVPLVTGTMEPVTLEPFFFPLAGDGSAGSLAVGLASGEVRADLPDWAMELPREILTLTLTYGARYRGEFSGGFAFTGANISLRLPDGTLVSARPDGHSQSVAVLAPGVLVAGLSSRFDVPAPATGSFALVIADGPATQDIPFTVTHTAPGSGQVFTQGDVEETGAEALYAGDLHDLRTVRAKLESNRQKRMENAGPMNC